MKFCQLGIMRYRNLPPWVYEEYQLHIENHRFMIFNLMFVVKNNVVSSYFIGTSSIDFFVFARLQRSGGCQRTAQGQRFQSVPWNRCSFEVCPRRPFTAGLEGNFPSQNSGDSKGFGLFPPKKSYNARDSKGYRGNLFKYW